MRGNTKLISQQTATPVLVKHQRHQCRHSTHRAQHYRLITPCRYELTYMLTYAEHVDKVLSL